MCKNFTNLSKTVLLEEFKHSGPFFVRAHHGRDQRWRRLNRFFQMLKPENNLFSSVSSPSQFSAASSVGYFFFQVNSLCGIYKKVRDCEWTKSIRCGLTNPWTTIVRAFMMTWQMLWRFIRDWSRKDRYLPTYSILPYLYYKLPYLYTFFSLSFIWR